MRNLEPLGPDEVLCVLDQWIIEHLLLSIGKLRIHWFFHDWLSFEKNTSPVKIQKPFDSQPTGYREGRDPAQPLRWYLWFMVKIITSKVIVWNVFKILRKRPQGAKKIFCNFAPNADFRSSPLLMLAVNRQRGAFSSLPRPPAGEARSQVSMNTKIQ